MPEPLIDPLHVLEVDLRCRVSLDQAGQVQLKFDRFHRPEEVAKANVVLRRYGRLLALQLQEGGVSVQKLMVRGLIELRGKRYVRGEGGRGPREE